MPTLFEWVKKLGQRHWYVAGVEDVHETLCGRPMLGNNYANVLTESEKTTCENCAKEKELLT